MNNEQLTSKVRQILLRDWDPCGVGDNDALSDEYDRYIPAIVELLAKTSSSTAINEILAKFEQELGVSLPEQQREFTVRSLLAVLT